MVINPILFFDDEVQDYIEKIGKNIRFYSRYYMVLLYDDSPNSAIIRDELANAAYDINYTTGFLHIMTYMHELPKRLLDDDVPGAEEIKNEFQNYEFDDVFSKMRWIATRFNVKDNLPVLLIASRKENGCIEIPLTNIGNGFELRLSIQYVTQIINEHKTNMDDLKNIINRRLNIECDFKKSNDELSETMIAIKNRKKPSNLIQELFNKYKIGRGNEHSMTEKDLAEKVGVSQKQLLSWKQDKATPSIENILKLSNVIGALDTEINDLLESFGYRSIDKYYKEDNELYNKYINRLKD